MYHNISAELYSAGGELCSPPHHSTQSSTSHKITTHPRPNFPPKNQLLSITKHGVLGARPSRSPCKSQPVGLGIWAITPRRAAELGLPRCTWHGGELCSPPHHSTQSSTSHKITIQTQPNFPPKNQLLSINKHGVLGARPSRSPCKSQPVGLGIWAITPRRAAELGLPRCTWHGGELCSPPHHSTQSSTSHKITIQTQPNFPPKNQLLSINKHGVLGARPSRSPCKSQPVGLGIWAITPRRAAELGSPSCTWHGGELCSPSHHSTHSSTSHKIPNHPQPNFPPKNQLISITKHGALGARPSRSPYKSQPIGLGIWAITSRQAAEFGSPSCTWHGGELCSPSHHFTQSSTSHKITTHPQHISTPKISSSASLSTVSWGRDRLGRRIKASPQRSASRQLRFDKRRSWDRQVVLGMEASSARLPTTPLNQTPRNSQNHQPQTYS